MPIYEYNCGACGATVEVFLRSRDQTPHCPECGAVLTDRLMSASNVLSRQTRREPGHTCCGREDRCDKPPCSGESSRCIR